MPIPSENNSSERILREALFHRVALKADPNAAHLVEPLLEVEAKLVDRKRDRENSQANTLEKQALLQQADYQLDQEVRLTELSVSKHVQKNRNAPDYRAAFPQGLSPVVALRGEAQERPMKNLATALRERMPDIAQEHADKLLTLAAAATEAEQAWLASQSAEGQARTEEVIARANLIRQLKKNRAALGVVYPGNRSRVRSYFRPSTRRTSGGEEEEIVEETEGGEE